MERLNIFASKEEIAAATPEQREAHFRLTGALVENPEQFGMTAQPDVRRENAEAQFDRDNGEDNA